MTDQMIPADKVREIIARWRDGVSDRGGLILDDLKDLLPPPTLPTLADMTKEGRAACQWMQADVGPVGRAVITYPDSGHVPATLIDRQGKVIYAGSNTITPRPDLPRMEWPGDKKPAPAPALPGNWRLADHEKRGRVIVTNPTPNPNGRVHFVIPADDPEGYGWNVCDPDKLTYLDQGADTSDTVPESTLSVGSVWKNANALTRACSESGRDQIAVIDKNGDVGVWDAELRGWRAYTPGPVFAPYTIIHTGRKADQ